MNPAVPQDWTYEEFLVFTMLYAASVDAGVGEEEESLIRQMLTEERYQAVKSVFEQCSDYKCINTILSYHDRYFATPEARERLLAHIRRTFESDQLYSQLEKEVMRLFKDLVR